MGVGAGLRISLGRSSSIIGAYASPLSSSSPSRTPPQQPAFLAQCYLRYLDSKFTARFDAYCYIYIVHKMNTYGLARHRMPIVPTSDSTTSTTSTFVTPCPSCSPQRPPDPLPPPSALILRTKTIRPIHNKRTARTSLSHPRVKLVIISSPGELDGFLLEFEGINEFFVFLRAEFSEFNECRDGEMGKGRGSRSV